MYCTNCGKEIDNKAVVCPNCGVPTQNYQANTAPSLNNNKVLIKTSKIFTILSFIVYPLAFIAVLILTIDAGASLTETSTDEENILFVTYIFYLIFVAIFGILGIIFGARSLKKIKKHEKPSLLLSILILIFTNSVSGVTLLCTRKEDYLL